MTSSAPIYKRPITLSTLYHHLQNPAPRNEPTIPTMQSTVPYDGTTCSETTDGEGGLSWTGAGSTEVDPPHVAQWERETNPHKARRLAEAAARIHSAMSSVDPVHQWLVPDMITLMAPVHEVCVDYEIRSEERTSEIGTSVRNLHGEVEKLQGEFVKLRGDMEHRMSMLDTKLELIVSLLRRA